MEHKYVRFDWLRFSLVWIHLSWIPINKSILAHCGRSAVGNVVTGSAGNVATSRTIAIAGPTILPELSVGGIGSEGQLKTLKRNSAGRFISRIQCALFVQ